MAVYGYTYIRIQTEVVRQLVEPHSLILNPAQIIQTVQCSHAVQASLLMSSSSVMATRIVTVEMTRPLHCARVSQYIIYGCWTSLSLVYISDWTTDKCLLPYYGGCSGTRECISSEFDVNCRVCLGGFVERDPVVRDCSGKIQVRSVTMCKQYCMEINISLLE